MSKVEDKKSKISFVFFGTPKFAVYTLEEMKKEGLLPSLVVTAPDRCVGRGMKLTPPPVKVWAEKNNIEVVQPEKLDSDFIELLSAPTGQTSPALQSSLRNDLSRVYQLFIVAAYGKIIPKEVLDIPKSGTLNVHPSLLPKFRGASPLQSTILSGDKETGVTIILMDEKMDHGDVVESRKSKVESLNAEELGEKLFRMGGKMLLEIIPMWIAEKIKATPQDHSKATFTKKVTKADGLIDLNDGAITNWRKFRAYIGFPSTYFFVPLSQLSEVRPPKVEKRQIRVKITNAELKNGKFIIKKVIPEGKKEIDYKNFIQK